MEKPREQLISDPLAAYNADVSLWDTTPDDQRTVLGPYDVPKRNPDINWPVEFPHSQLRGRLCFRTRDGRVFDVRLRGSWSPWAHGARQRLHREHVRNVMLVRDGRFSRP